MESCHFLFTILTKISLPVWSITVFEILLVYRDTGSWEKALLAGVPAGKGYILPTESWDQALTPSTPMIMSSIQHCHPTSYVQSPDLRSTAIEDKDHTPQIMHICYENLQIWCYANLFVTLLFFSDSPIPIKNKRFIFFYALFIK